MSGMCDQIFEERYKGSVLLVKEVSKSGHKLGWIRAASFLQEKAKDLQKSDNSPEAMRQVELINELASMLIDEV